jgi:hypothetical protein
MRQREDGSRRMSGFFALSDLVMKRLDETDIAKTQVFAKKCCLRIEVLKSSAVANVAQELHSCHEWSTRPAYDTAR